jgi:hypothetical protein
MFTWLVAGLLAVAAVITEWFVAPASPQFNVVQGLISLVIFVVVVFVLALLVPALWRHWQRSRR